MRQMAERKLLPNHTFRKAIYIKSKKEGKKLETSHLKYVEKRGKTMLLGMFYTLKW